MYALPLEAVEKVIRSVELTRVPNAPELVLGLINLRGRTIPVVNIRRYFGLPEREMEIEDYLVIARTSTWRIAFLVDWVHGVESVDESDMDRSGELFPEMDEYIQGVCHLGQKSVIIYDSDSLLSTKDASRLEKSMGGR